MKNKHLFTPSRLVYAKPEVQKEAEGPAVAAEALPLTRERIDEYEKQVKGFVGTVQKDVDEVMQHYKLQKVDVNAVSFDKAGKCTDTALLTRLNENIYNQDVKDKVLTMINFAQTLQEAIKSAREGRISTDEAMQAALGGSLTKIQEASRIEFTAKGDPLADLSSPTLKSGDLALSNVSEILDKRKEAEANRRSAEGEEKAILAREREEEMKFRNNPVEAAKAVFEDILRQDVMAGINNGQFTRAKEDLNLSNEMIGHLKRYCLTAKEGTAYDVDLAKIGATMVTGDELPVQPGPTRLEIVPSKDGKFVQLRWAVQKTPSRVGGLVTDVNTLNIALDGSAYTLDTSKPEGQQLAYNKPNLKKAPVNPEQEEQGGFEKQYEDLLAALKDAAPGARISLIQKTTRYFPEEGVTKDVLVNIVIKKWHDIDGRKDQYAIFRGEKVGDEKWGRILRRELVGINDIPNLAKVPELASNGRIASLEQKPERETDKNAGIMRSFTLATKEVVSLSQALRMPGMELPAGTDKKYKAAVDQVFDLMKHYKKLPEGTEEMLMRAGFKVEKTDSELTVAYNDAVDKTTRTENISMEKAQA